MKRILFKSGHIGFGGVERTQVEYINYLHSINADFKLVLDKEIEEQYVMNSIDCCPLIYLKSKNDMAELENARNNKNISLLYKIKYNLALSKERGIAKRNFANIVKDFKPEIAINYHNDYHFNLNVLKNSKNIIWVHSAIVSNWRPLKSAMKFIKKISKYDLIVCVSKGAMEEIIELKPTLKHKTTYLYNPINFEKIIQLSDEKFTNDEINLANEKFLLMVSRIDTVSKNYPTLFKAFDIAKDNGYDGKLYVVGGGNINDVAIVKDLLNKSKYKDEIKLLGNKINPFNWMKRCDKFILSTNFEGLPTVLLEALAVNDTVISADCRTGPNEILDNGKYGYLFPVGDASELAKLIMEAKPKDRSEINSHLLQFSPTVVLQKFNNILNEI